MKKEQGSAGGKLIIFSAPSGSGKTSIVRKLIEYPELNLAFSVSATSREKRDYEEDGKHYYFITPEDFKKKIEENAFVEWEEVYPDHFYGTLKSEIERLTKAGKNIIFDIDVKGGMNIKKMFPDKALSVFVQVPDFDELKRRLESRKTESPEKIKLRLDKAKEEAAYASEFDVILMNDDLEKSVNKAYSIVKEFIEDEKK
jgi:guanylate kinase